MGKSIEEIEEYGGGPVKRLLEFEQHHYPQGRRPSLTPVEYLPKGQEKIRKMVLEWHENFDWRRMDEWDGCYGQLFNLISFSGGCNEPWSDPGLEERYGFPDQAFLEVVDLTGHAHGTSSDSESESSTPAPTGHAHGSPTAHGRSSSTSTGHADGDLRTPVPAKPMVRLRRRDECDNTDVRKLSDEQVKQIGKDMAHLLFGNWKTPRQVSWMDPDERTAEMGLTYWSKLFADDIYGLGFEWFNDRKWLEGFNSVESCENLSPLQYAAWMQDWEACRQILAAAPEEANDIGRKDAAKCASRTALQILCEGPPGRSELERAELSDTIFCFLTCMRVDRIFYQMPDSRRTFAHLLCDSVHKTANLRDSIYWLCEKTHSSPLFKAQPGVDGWIAVDNELEAWDVCADNLLNTPDKEGRGCLDLACKHTMGGGNDDGVYRVRICGGVEQLNAPHNPDHIKWSQDGPAWRKALNAQNSKYRNPNTD